MRVNCRLQSSVHLQISVSIVTAWHMTLSDLRVLLKNNTVYSFYVGLYFNLLNARFYQYSYAVWLDPNGPIGNTPALV